MMSAYVYDDGAACDACVSARPNKSAMTLVVFQIYFSQINRVHHLQNKAIIVAVSVLAMGMEMGMAMITFVSAKGQIYPMPVIEQSVTGADVQIYRELVNRRLRNKTVMMAVAMMAILVAMAVVQIIHHHASLNPFHMWASYRHHDDDVHFAFYD
jgi:hypothetical protein